MLLDCTSRRCTDTQNTSLIKRLIYKVTNRFIVAYHFMVRIIESLLLENNLELLKYISIAYIVFGQKQRQMINFQSSAFVRINQ